MTEFTRKRGVQLTGISGQDIKLLWQLGLLRADYIQSNIELDYEDLTKLDVSPSLGFVYIDSRRLAQQPDGLVGTAEDMVELDREIELFFHPFRYYVIWKLLYPVFLPPSPNITPVSAFRVGIKRYSEVVCKSLEAFNKDTSSEDFPRRVESLNDIAEFAIATEPWAYSLAFGSRNISRLGPDELGIDAQDYINLDDEEIWARSREIQRHALVEHKRWLTEHVHAAGLERLEQVRQALCLDSEKLHNDKELLTLLRLAKGRAPLGVEGELGGALLLRVMAEFLRRVSEEVFESELSEEDEMGSGVVFRQTRIDNYGSHRLLDQDRSVAQAFVRRFVLDYGVRVRWYVEGATEWGALAVVFEPHTQSGVELHDLGGRVVSASRAAFEGNLEMDIQNKIFSFVMIDGDRRDYINAVKKAAQEDKLFGRLFIQEPDFELANFTHDELEQIIWGIAEENGARLEQREELRQAVLDASSGKEITDCAKAVFQGGPLRALSRNQQWGARLMKLALDNPELPDGSTRPIIESVWAAQRGLRANFDRSYRESKVDPESGDLIERA